MLPGLAVEGVITVGVIIEEVGVPGLAPRDSDLVTGGRVDWSLRLVSLLTMEGGDLPAGGSSGRLTMVTALD